MSGENLELLKGDIVRMLAEVGSATDREIIRDQCGRHHESAKRGVFKCGPGDVRAALVSLSEEGRILSIDMDDEPDRWSIPGVAGYSGVSP